MRGYKNFDGNPHPGDLRHLVEIGYTENAVNENGYPEPKDVVVCKVWASVVDAGNQHYRAADVINTEAVLNFTICYSGKSITIGIHRKAEGAYYAPPVEYSHGGPAPAPAHPFIRPAYDTRQDESYEIIRDGLRDAIDHL